MEKNFKKYTALPLSRVKTVLNQKYNILLRENNPPKQNQGKGQKRVISIKKVDADVIEIIWSRENYVNPGSEFPDYS